MRAAWNGRRVGEGWISDMKVAGWDVGGAHLKVALAVDGRIVDAAQFPSPLASDTRSLAAAFDSAERFRQADRHAITMTGELADIFDDRSAGVAALMACILAALPADSVRLYAGRAGFIRSEQAVGHVEDVASANWHASAKLVARAIGAGLFLDIGSTTTDVIPLAGGVVVARGYTDAERLACGELVYTGLVRTPVMAVASHVPMAGAIQHVVAERFATMADVYRVLELLPVDADQMPTADGRDKSVKASRVRLARMVGHDAGESSDAEWRFLASVLADRQLRLIEDGLALVRSRFPGLGTVVGAGVGASLAQTVSDRQQLAYRPFADLIPAVTGARAWAAHCAPASAVALLLEA